MGRKQSGEGKQIYFYFTVLMFLIPLACTLEKTISTKIVDTTGEEARTYLALGRTYLAKGDYGRSLKENEKVLSLAGKTVPMDEALFFIGLIQAHPANPARDNRNAIVSFQRLIRDYPESLYCDPGKALMGLLQENERLTHKADKLNSTVDEQKKIADKLHSTVDEQKKIIDRLNNLIDDLKKVDIDVEQKKRGVAK